MEKIKGRWYGSCWECGHSYPVDHDGEPLVCCIPKNELLEKYARACEYLIPRCEHVCLTESEVIERREGAKSRTKKES